MGFSAPSPDNRVTRLAIFRQTAEKCHKNVLVHRCGTASRVAIPRDQALCYARSLSLCKNKLENRLVCADFCALIHFCDKKRLANEKKGGLNLLPRRARESQPPSAA